MTDVGRYEVLPVETDRASLASYIDLFTASFGSTDITPEFLDWQYNQNPLGRVIGYNAFLNGELAAHYVVIPTQARLAGQLTRGLLSLNTATHPVHQKRGLFPTLAEMTYSRGHELGHEFVIGVASQNSFYGLTKKLGFQNVGRLDTRFVLALRTREPSGTLDYIGEWTPETTRWRMSNPRVRYSVKNLGKVAQIHGRSRRFPTLVGQIPADCVPDGFEQPGIIPIKLWVGMDCRIDSSRLVQASVPWHLRPVPLTLTFRDLAGKRKIDRRSTVFWTMDFDGY